MVRVTRRKSLLSAVSIRALIIILLLGVILLVAVTLTGNEHGDALFQQRQAVNEGEPSSGTSTTLPVAAVNREIASTESTPQDFFAIAKKTGTDKVAAVDVLEKCVESGEGCKNNMKDAANHRCRPWGHFYHTLYNRWLGPYSTQDTEPFQFLEIGYYNGRGFDAYMDFLPKAEAHSMEIACIEPGPRDEGKWPWGNFAEKNPRYNSLRQQERLHCGDASDYDFLQKIWTTKMKRPDAPPLKVVVDDGAHLADHMATSLFYWFPKIEPRGLLIIEDVEPTSDANKFRTQVLPQVMKDLHYCGEPNFKDELCFPTIWPLLASVHCEMHICVFERNDEPPVEYTKEQSLPPEHALNARHCFDKSSA